MLWLKLFNKDFFFYIQGEKNFHNQGWSKSFYLNFIALVLKNLDFVGKWKEKLSLRSVI